MIIRLLACTLLMNVALHSAEPQVKRTTIPMGDALSKALAKCSLTGENSRPFHIRVAISEPENPQSPYQGIIEEWWLSPDQWRREVTDKDGMRQTIIVVGGKKSEKDEGDYFPHWLQEFVTAIIDPVPGAAAWSASGAVIEQITMPNGDKSDVCARAKSKIGVGDNAVDAFSSVCFDGDGRLKFVGSPSYGMEFHNYSKFDKKQIARELVNDPEPGTRLVGNMNILEDEAKASHVDFAPLPTDDNRFRSVEVGPAVMQTLTADQTPIEWPAVRSGVVKGKLAVYISVDNTGQVREAWPLNSDNAGLEDPAREQVRKWKLKPSVDGHGTRVQVEGGIGFSFETKIDNPLPLLSNADIRQLATKVAEPVWPANGLQRGQIVTVEISVNEQGKLTGTSYKGTTSAAAMGALMEAIKKWEFRPLIRDGKPQYFHGTLEFVVP